MHNEDSLYNENNYYEAWEDVTMQRQGQMYSKIE